MRPTTAQQRFRHGHARRIEITLAAALLLHALAIQFGPAMDRELRGVETPAPLQLIQVRDPAPVYRIMNPEEPSRPSLEGPVLEIRIAEDTALPPVPALETGDIPGLTRGTAPAGDRSPFTSRHEDPVLLRSRAPDYPEIAREAGAEGDVLVEVRIGPDGRVIAARVVRSNTVPALEEAARRAALEWLFQPARQRDLAVEAVVHIPFRFRLGS